MSPHLAGTDELPVNVKQKYEMMLENKEIFTVVTADALKRDVVEKRGEVRLAFSGNGVDYNHFHNEIDVKFPLDDAFKKVLEIGQPVIGYYGALAKWFDYDLIKKISQTGRYQIVLFGIAYDDSLEKSGLDKFENIHFLGAKNYNILQNYAAHMDVLTIPFLINDITRATSPVKLFEYMAMNKPIVTTDMDECRKYKSVLIGHSHEELFNESLDLKERIDAFIAGVEYIHKQWDENGTLNHYQTFNAVSTYLWLRYPDKYYIYKPSVAKLMFEKLGVDMKLTPLRANAVIKTYELYDYISKKNKKHLPQLCLLIRH